MNELEIIALSGQSGSGKTYLQEAYLDDLEYFAIAFADMFKIVAIGRKLVSYEEAYFIKSPETRTLLQNLGTAEGRLKYGESVWIDSTYAMMHHFNRTWGISKYVITDCRFVNEADTILERGGKVIRINAPNRVAANKLTPEQRLHPSEISLDNYTNFTGIIHNDFGQEDTVAEELYNILEYHPELNEIDV